jgi:cobyric acid synthase CobQ
MDVRQYHSYKEQAWKAVTASYDALADDYDVVVLEGAGSPGEINLKKHDIVNMRMARYARSPVLVVGDIDRGGVYASFAGTMDVLEEWERNLIAGFVVNKFRGDASLLHEAHLFIKEHTGKDVFGVVPYITGMNIPQEDSVSLREGFYGDRYTGSEQVEIAVIDLPHISNFTDIDPLFQEPDVNVRFVKQVSSLGNPDAIILPGSKNVAGDLADIRRRGFDTALKKYGEQGGTIVGICGGYQMLGRVLKDPHGLETQDDSVPGFGLINVDTVLEAEKTLVKREGVHLESGLPVHGYEIHHGVTAGDRFPVLAFAGTETCGSRNHDGTLWGAYLHGIFDADRFRRWFIDRLRVKKQLPPVGRIVAPYDIDSSIDDLADLVRSCFDMDQVHRLLGM